MAQLTYSINMPVGVAGLISDTTAPRQVGTYVPPVDDIPYGRGVAKVTGNVRGIELPASSGAKILGVSVRDAGIRELDEYPAKSAVAVLGQGRIYVTVDQAVTPDSDVYVRYDGKSQVQTFVFSADIITGNTVAVDVDGVSLTQAFDTDHLTSITALAAQIAAEPGVLTAAVGGGSNRTITVTAAVHATDVVLDNEGVTGGASQATITITETVASISDDDRGMFRADADSSTALQITQAKFLSSASAGGVAILNINLP